MHKFFLAIAAAIWLGTASVALALPKALTVTDPPGCQGTDVDPLGAETVNTQVGNINLKTMNDDPDQVTVSFDSEPFKTPRSLARVIFTKAGELKTDLTVSFHANNTNWFCLFNHAGRGTSPIRTLSLRQLPIPGPASNRYAYITFSKPMKRVGFVLSNVHESDSFTVKFYAATSTDRMAGENEVGSYTFSGGTSENDGHEVFIAHESDTGIRRVQIMMSSIGSPSSPSDYRAFDDLSFVMMNDKDAAEADKKNKSAHPHEAQREAGQRFIEQLNRIADGDTITIPPGKYRFTGKQQPVLLHDHSNVTINAKDVTLIFEDASKGGFRMDQCRDVTIRGMTLAYDPLPYTQGFVRAMNPEQKTIDIEIEEGFPVPDDAWIKAANGSMSFKSMFFDPDTDKLRDVRLDWTDSLQAMGGRKFRVGFKFDFAFTQPSAPDAFRIGDRYVLPWRRHMPAMQNTRSARITLEEVTVNSSPAMAIVETSGDGANVYRRCRIVRPEGSKGLLAANADGFHSFQMRKGPLIEHCEFAHTGDDLIAVHNFFSIVLTQPSESKLVLATIFDRDFETGSLLRVYDLTDARPLGQAKVTKVTELNDPDLASAARALPATIWKERQLRVRGLVRAKVYEVELDRALKVTPYALANSDYGYATGTIIRNNHLYDGRIRGVFLRAHDSLIEGNTIERTGMAGISLTPDRFFIEGPFCRNVTVRSNRLVDTGLTVLNQHFVHRENIGAIMIGCDFGPDFRSSLLHEGIRIESNTITRPAGPAIFMANVDGAQISGNTFDQPLYRMQAFKDAAEPGPRFVLQGSTWPHIPASPIAIMASREIHIEGNTISNAPPFMQGMVSFGPHVDVDKIKSSTQKTDAPSSPGVLE